MKRVGAWLVMLIFAIVATGCATTEPRPDYYAYPQRGQTPEQVSRDQYECQEWAKQQSGSLLSGYQLNNNNWLQPSSSVVDSGVIVSA